ncbi:hypothetical protein QYF36_009621 [Acer negundo]|nr:hypothetical protein QYF36_009621 [Acer negundo]
MCFLSKWLWWFVEYTRSQDASRLVIGNFFQLEHDRMSRNRRSMEEEEDSMIEEDNFTMMCPEDAEFQKPKIISLWNADN